MARLIREAVDACAADDKVDIVAVLDETFGTLPDLELPSRDEWDVTRNTRDFEGMRGLRMRSPD